MITAFKTMKKCMRKYNFLVFFFLISLFFLNFTAVSKSQKKKDL